MTSTNWQPKVEMAHEPHALNNPVSGLRYAFEQSIAAAAIISLTLLGQQLELKPRSQTSAAIKALLG